MERAREARPSAIARPSHPRRRTSRRADARAPLRRGLVRRAGGVCFPPRRDRAALRRGRPRGAARRIGRQGDGLSRGRAARPHARHRRSRGAPCLPAHGHRPRARAACAPERRGSGALGERSQQARPRPVQVAGLFADNAQDRVRAAAGRAMIVVREARPEDDAAVGEILVAGYVTAYARKMPEVVVSETRRATLRDVAAKRALATVLVVEVDGAVKGTVTLFKPGAPTSEAWVANAADLRHLAVDPSMQGKGLGKPLLDEAERIARDDWKVAAICLHVRRGNAGVAKLYISRGYLRTPEGDLDYPEVKLDAYVLRF